jgi:hypothetical protein
MRNAGTAPFIYCDGVPAFGVGAGGNIEIELAARVLVPKGDGASVIVEMCCTGHLRLAIPSAMALIDALTKAIDMAKGPEQKQN